MKPAKLTDFQLVFLSSRANGCDYREPDEIGTKWTWPEGYMTRRLKELKEEKGEE